MNFRLSSPAAPRTRQGTSGDARVAAWHDPSVKPSSTPRLSIILPVLNEAPRIAVALAALAPLRAAGMELIVVDGGSVDGTAALCGGAVDLCLAGPRGRARQMNAGAAVASGEALLFLHADTTLPARAPALIASALAAHAWGRFDVRIDGRSRWLPMVAGMMNRRSRLTGIATGDQALFMRRDAFEAVGGFPDQALMEDIEISKRLRRQVGAPACLREKVVTSGRRWDERGAWRTIVLMWRLRLAYWLGVSADRLAAAYR
jgi:rSAM/selenodomain-associated transferase 2